MDGTLTIPFYYLNKGGRIKKTLKRSLVIGATLASVGVTSVAGMGLAHAASSSSGGQSNLIDKLVSTFHLNKADVQKVFDENQATRQADHNAKTKERLDTAVKDGKLTQDQEDKLIAKQKELQATREANRDEMAAKTDAERKAATQTERDAFKKWLSDNGIPKEYAMGMRGEHGGPNGGAPPAN